MRKPNYMRNMRNEDDVQDVIDGLEIAAESLRNYRDFGFRHESFFESALSVVEEVRIMLYRMSGECPF